MRAPVFRWIEPPISCLVTYESMIATASAGVTLPSEMPRQVITIDDGDKEKIRAVVWRRQVDFAAYEARYTPLLAQRDWCAFVEWWECNVWGADEEKETQADARP
jgi:hypothetical protein